MFSFSSFGRLACPTFSALALSLLLGGCSKTPVAATGCITIDGEGGYAKIADAVAVAPAGATVTLCGGRYRSALVLTKDLTLVGEGTVLLRNTQGDPPPSPVTVSDGAVVTITGMRIQSQASAVVLVDGDLTLDGVIIDAASDWCVDAQGGSLLVTNSELTLCRKGGVQSAGADLTITNSTLSSLEHFAVSASGGTVSITGSTIDTVSRPPGADADALDGTAIFVADASAPVGVTNSSFLNIDWSAFWLRNTGLDVDACTINVAGQAVVAESLKASTGQEVLVSNSSFTGLKDRGIFSQYSTTVSDSTLEGLALPNSASGVVLTGVGRDSSLIRTTLRSWGQNGVFADGSPLDTDPPSGTLTLDSLTIADSAVHGVWLSDVELATITGLTIPSLLRQTIAGSTAEEAIGLYADRTELAVDGVTITNADSFNLLFLNGATGTVSNLTLTDNKGIGVTSFGSAVTVDGFTCTGQTEGEIPVTGGGTTPIAYCVYDTASAGAYRNGTLLSPSGGGIQFALTDSVISDITVTTPGDWGVYIDDGGSTFFNTVDRVTVTDPGFTGFFFAGGATTPATDISVDGSNSTAFIYGSYISSSSPVLLRGTFTEVDYGVYIVSDSSPILDTCSFSGGTTGVRSWSATPTIRDSTFTGQGTALDLDTSNAGEITGNTIDGATSRGIACWNCGGPISGNTILGSQGDGIYVYQSSAPDLPLEIRDNILDGGSANGIHINQALAGLTLDGNTVLDQGGVGILVDQSSNLLISNNTLSTNGTGMRLLGSSEVVVSPNNLIQGSLANGLEIGTGTISGQVDANSLINNVGWGMSCDPGTMLIQCTNTMSGNILGDLNGCGFCSVL